ncbi:MAG TPA: TonB-dependent receptor plug domain-containing protein, partial [Oceanipulchritudo sp.]|nr:TonB-dependent receptor plug domain-containing protein [Oceanipulchritudo sp.]
MNRKGFLSVFSATLILGFTGGAMFAQDATPEEDVFELSPFEVSTNSDAGYYASQTLSGGRVNSRIEDLGTSIQVVTEELMQDLNATSADEILLYTANTDVGGPSGNISTPAAGGNGTPDDTALRVNPAGNNRIRAIGSADLTRNFFRTSIPFDSYNSGRLDILRGANSFLFGLGSPSGIMNYGLDRAEFRNSGQLGIRFTNEDLEDNFSRRFELNVNQVLAEDMLAVRVAGVLDRQEYVQELAKTDTDRFYGALTFKPLKNRNIYLRVTGETGDINSVPPSALGPLESLSSWLDNKTGIDFGTASGRFIADPYTNVVVNNHTYQGKDANGNNLNIPTGGTEFRQKWGIVYDGTEDANGLPTRAMQYGVDGTMWRTGDPFFDPDKNYPTSANRAVYFMGYANINEIGGDYAGYRPQGLTDYSVFDFRKSLLMGGVDRVESDFDTYNISLEATSKDRNFGIELVYNSESFERTNTIPVGNPTLFMDLNRTLVTGPNSLFGDTNPNFGRIFVTGSNASIFSSEVDRKTYRATAYGKIDFREKFPDNRVLSLLGNHTLTMLLDSDKRNEYGTELRMYSFGNNADWHLAQTNGTMFTRQANFSIYVSPAYPDAFTDPSFKMTDFKGIQPRTDINLSLPSGFSV